MAGLCERHRGTLSGGIAAGPNHPLNGAGLPAIIQVSTFIIGMIFVSLQVIHQHCKVILKCGNSSFDLVNSPTTFGEHDDMLVERSLDDGEAKPELEFMQICIMLQASLLFRMEHTWLALCCLDVCNFALNPLHY